MRDNTTGRVRNLCSTRCRSEHGALVGRGPKRRGQRPWKVSEPSLPRSAERGALSAAALHTPWRARRAQPSAARTAGRGSGPAVARRTTPRSSTGPTWCASATACVRSRPAPVVDRLRRGLDRPGWPRCDTLRSPARCVPILRRCHRHRAAENIAYGHRLAQRVPRRADVDALGRPPHEHPQPQVQGPGRRYLALRRHRPDLRHPGLRRLNVHARSTRPRPSRSGPLVRRRCSLMGAPGRIRTFAPASGGRCSIP